MTKVGQTRFYSPEEYRREISGSNYDLNIDNAIIQTLLKYRRLCYGDLMTKVKALHVGKSLGLSSYIAHIKRLTEVGILDREDHGLGRRVEYSLTKDATKQVLLNLIGVPRYKIILLRKIYQMMLFNDISKFRTIRIESEDDLDKILAELRVSRSDLSWQRVSYRKGFDAIDLVYPNSGEKGRRLFTRRYWAERKGKSSVSEIIEFICYPLAREGNLDLILTKVEYWQINKFSENIKHSQKYLCDLPGFSIEEILAAKFKDDDVNFAFNALRDLKIIQPSIEFRGKMRFTISDRKLHGLLTILWDFSEIEISRMVVKWKYFEEQDTCEANRMKRLIGNHEANSFFRKSSIMRSQHYLDIRKFETAEEYDQYIEKEHFSYHRELDRAANLQIFKDRIRGNRKMVTKKEKRDDLLQYVNFRKEKLFEYLEQLPFRVGHNIDGFKMKYKETLKKYLFLQPVLKVVYPKVFEIIDDEKSSE